MNHGKLKEKKCLISLSLPFVDQIFQWLLSQNTSQHKSFCHTLIKYCFGETHRVAWKFHVTSAEHNKITSILIIESFLAKSTRESSHKWNYLGAQVSPETEIQLENLHSPVKFKINPIFVLLIFFLIMLQSTKSLEYICHEVSNHWQRYAK